MNKLVMFSTVFVALVACLTVTGGRQASAQVVGTTNPIYYPEPTTGIAGEDALLNKEIAPGDSYYSVSVVGSQLNLPKQGFWANLFSKAKEVCITTSASVANAPDDFPKYQGINAVLPVTQGKITSFGLSPLLVWPAPRKLYHRMS